MLDFLMGVAAGVVLLALALWGLLAFAQRGYKEWIAGTDEPERNWWWAPDEKESAE